MRNFQQFSIQLDGEVGEEDEGVDIGKLKKNYRNKFLNNMNF